MDLAQVNIAQTSTTVKAVLVRLLERCRRVFPANFEIVPACNRDKLQSPLANNSCTPHAANQRRYSPEETAMIQSEITKLMRSGAIRRLHSAWAANSVVVMKKDGTARVCQEYRRLNTLLQLDSGELGDIPSIFDGMRGSTCFISTDLAAGFTQLEIAEEDSHNTVRDARSELWDFNRCGFGLKTIPQGVAAYVGEALGPLKGKYIQNWLDDIIIHTRGVDEHVQLLKKLLARFHQAVGKPARVDMVRPAAEICCRGGQQARRPAVANEDRRGGQALMRRHGRIGEVSLGHVQLPQEVYAWIQFHRGADREPVQG